MLINHNINFGISSQQLLNVYPWEFFFRFGDSSSFLFNAHHPEACFSITTSIF